MIYMYQIPWDEMNVDDELTVRCENVFFREVETGLRRRINQWDHMRCDMVMEPTVYLLPVLHGDDYGITVKQRGIQSAEYSNLSSYRYIPQIKGEKDIEKIAIPQITYDEAATRKRQTILEDIFDDALEVRTGIRFYNVCPWDSLVKWTGVTEILTDLAMRPDYVHRLMERITGAIETRLATYANHNLLLLNNNDTEVGQGGYGYTDELPGKEYDQQHVRYHNTRGGAKAQIFSEVSPSMHEEFALRYELRSLKRFGLNYYGCCEPLHLKVDIAREIPNLRKISMSPMVDIVAGAEAVGEALVYSCKPNPAFLATRVWDPSIVRKELRNMLQIARSNGCHVELLLKDISTVRREPQRLWEWAAIASEVSSEFARG